MVNDVSFMGSMAAKQLEEYKKEMFTLSLSLFKTLRHHEGQYCALRGKVVQKRLSTTIHMG